MTKLERYEVALQDIKMLQIKYEWSVALKSIEEQLEYLINLENDKSGDFSKLGNINIGVLAAREVEDMDRSIADQLHSISTEVKRMVVTPGA